MPTISGPKSTTVVLLAVKPLLPFGAFWALTVFAPHPKKIAEASSAQEILHLFITGSSAAKHGTKTDYGIIGLGAGPVGNGLAALLAHPDQKRRLIQSPDLIRTAIEEILRYESSNQLGNRMTTKRVELSGFTLDAGTPVTLCIGAANRDPCNSRIRRPSTSAVSRTGIWRSALARINAQAWRWHGSRARSRSRGLSRAFRIMGSMGRRSAVVVSVSADSCACRVWLKLKGRRADQRSVIRRLASPAAQYADAIAPYGFPQSICPTGGTREFLSRLACRNISVFQKIESGVWSAPSCPGMRGASRSSRRAGRDAVDVLVPADERR